jgi:hypothetical protein
MSSFSNYKLFEGVSVRNSDNKLLVIDTDNTNNFSLHSSDGSDTNVDTLSIKKIINKNNTDGLEICNYDGSTVSPLIKIKDNYVNLTSNVGIKILNPSYELDVLGDIHCSGQFIGSFSGTATNANYTTSAHPLVGTNQTQTLSGKTFSDSLVTDGDIHLGSSNSSSNNKKKLYFNFADASSGGNYLYNDGTNFLIYQSGSHWGEANFGVKTNGASGAYSYVRFYTYQGNPYIRGYGSSLQHSNSWSSASDDRLKTNEKIITSEKGKKIIMKLRPQNYYKYQELNDTNNGPKLDSNKSYEAGFIAQEIFFEIPELRFLLSGTTKDHKEIADLDIDNIDFSNIQEDPDYSIFGKDILGISYEQIVPYLTAHNQEQQKEIDTLKTENQQQQTKINELTSIIDKLKTANSFEEFKNSL